MNLEKLKDARLFDFVITNTMNKDKVGDMVPDSEIGEALDGWLLRDAPITDGHSNRVIGKGLRWWKSQDGDYVGRGVVHSNSRIADMAWKEIQDGKKKMVSIGGAALNKQPNEYGGEDLNDLEILEVAICEEGMHPDANILDVNQFAKGSPFFLKAVIKTNIEVSKPGNVGYSEEWNKCVEEEKRNNPGINAYAVCTARLGAESFKSNSSERSLLEKGGNSMAVKKEDLPPAPTAPTPPVDPMSGLTEQLSQINAGIKQILEHLSGQTGSPVAEKAEGGDLGAVKDVNPSPDGGKAILPKTADDESDPLQPDPSDQPKDKIPVTEKTLEEMVEKAVSKVVRKGSTPDCEDVSPTQVKKEKNLALDLVNGKISVEKARADLLRQRKTDHLKKQMALLELGGA